MKIGIDARFYNPEASGLARYASELVPRLLELPDAKQHQFVVLLPESVAEPKTTHSNTKFIRTAIKHYSLAEQTTLVSLINAQKLDLCHFLHFNHPLLYGGRSVFTIHDLILTFYPGIKPNMLKLVAYQLMIRHALRKASQIIAVSHTTKREIAEYYHVDPHKISVIYEAVDKRYKKCDNQRLLDEVKQKYGINKPYLIYIGQIRVHKNIVRLISAFASVHARNRSLQLVLIGKADASYLKMVQSEIRKHHLGKAVVLGGFAGEADLPVLYSGAIASVMPSLIEGFGLPPLESMACQCPVVSSNASCLPEIAGDGALYFDPTDTVDMASKIGQVISSADLRQVLIQAGLKRIEQFSWGKMAEETLALYTAFDKQTKSDKQ